ncbi:multifunctional CCA addition/repair protein [Pseudohongiella spirulinae]|uniref:Multifunctional CCA protein n=1 Tax=Pseudohongiella spirulinae TaxID=1249552 RepID=A0A0S2KGI7_9GAMM|nr:multifunctional CCA addition/repair protein [Pseudohongiella spirulinae]ALO47369.1 Multifunctional CCA protein [Pseudohongiella spirulinae]
MKIYLVGGAVRDTLLGLDGADRDWVVVGATPAQMIELGYTPVGKDFPVFLHPQTHEEYALARTERKSGTGYKGFTVYAAPDVTLEQDLQRRDLTINAMAQDQNGTLIDPWGGVEDLAKKQLRHVSPAFSEDPLRVLRVARFMARFKHLGFTIAAETRQLMAKMTDSGELSALTAERVWQEIQTAMSEKDADAFVLTLREAGALKVLLPEVNALFGVPQPAQWHPEIDTGLHTLLSLQQACRLSDDPVVRFACLMHDVGKGLTPQSEWPRHIAHEQRGVELIRQACTRLRSPNEYQDLALLVCQYHTHCHSALGLKPSTLLKTLNALDVFRRPQRLQKFLLACQADARGRTGFEDSAYPQADLFRKAFEVAQAISVPELLKQHPVVKGAAAGEQIRERLQDARLRAIRKLINSGKQNAIDD